MNRRAIRFFNTSSNIAYLIGGLWILWHLRDLVISLRFDRIILLGFDPVAAASIGGMGFLAAASARFHWSATREDNILDRLGMFLAFAPVAVMAARLIIPIDPLLQVALLAVLIFLLVLLHDQLYSYGLLAIVAGGPLLVNVYLSGWAGLLPLAYFVFGFTSWLLDARRDHTGPDKWDALHIPWHIGTAIGAALLVRDLLLLYLKTL